jgi:hypothetical protein
MNYCPKKHFIPDGALACPVCVAQRFEVGQRQMQVEYLRRAVNREYSYLLRVTKGSGNHALMYPATIRTFCGTDLAARPRIDYVSYDPEALAKLCPFCREEIAHLLEAAP